ncbi:MAG: LytTR family DNA-binding domain-containing protein [Woeseiaceae bacterium]|nr:LytTR family DNA-binding domain-containing protein [Woeseiaceae bacterium]
MAAPELAPHDQQITAIIVDDEAPARRLLRSLLESEPGVTVIDECTDGNVAIGAIAKHGPDVVFLDVDMPIVDGISVVRHFGDDRNAPYFVFVTAYDEYAIEAFELNAVDYIVKPISRARLSAAVGRAKLVKRKDSTVELTAQLLALASHQDFTRTSRTTEPRLTLKKRDVVCSVRFDEIVWVEAANQYVRIHTGDDSFIMSESLGKFGTRIPDSRFVRVHRSAIVNGHHIDRVVRSGNGAYALHLSTGAELTLARSRASLLPRLLRLSESSDSSRNGERVDSSSPDR